MRRSAKSETKHEESFAGMRDESNDISSTSDIESSSNVKQEEVFYVKLIEDEPVQEELQIIDK